MRCEQARALLEARYELERSAELTAHLAECRECAALDAHDGALDSWLALSEAVVTRPGFDTRFFARLEQEKSRARQRRWLRWAWALVPAAAAAAALLWLRPVPAPGVAGALPVEVAPDDVALAVDLELVEQLEVAGKLDEVEAYDVLSELDDGELERMAQEAR
jgi:anti-sigma factor RsiW